MKEFIDKQTDKIEEKEKVTSLEIIVTGTKDKPYFQIKYKEVGKEDYNIGYGSYDLNNVFGWKEECFEIVNELAEEYKGGWIPCSERLPKPNECVLCSLNRDNPTIMHTIIIARYDGANHWHNGIVEAWQPLPAPFKEGE